MNSDHYTVYYRDALTDLKVQRAVALLEVSALVCIHEILELRFLHMTLASRLCQDYVHTRAECFTITQRQCKEI